MRKEILKARDKLRTSQVCTKCGIEKSLDEFYKTKRKNCKNVSISSSCIECHKKEHALKQYPRIVKSKKKYDDKPGFKICRRCEVEKPISEFGNHKSQKDGLRCNCKDCENKQTKKYKEDHKDEIETYTKKYREEHKEERREKFKIYYENNKEELKLKRKEYEKENAEEISIRRKPGSKRYYESHQEEIYARVLAWSKTPKGKACSLRAVHKRRSRGSNLPNTLTSDELEIILIGQGGKCNHCGKEFGKDLRPTKDHILPMTRGGGLTFENVQALCRSCNDRKFNRTELEQIEYLKTRSGFDHIIKRIIENLNHDHL